LLERKERLQLEQCSGTWKPVAHCSDEGWGFYGHFNSGLGVLFSLAMNLWAFLGELVCFIPYWGRGNNLESILLISPVADLSDPVSPLQDAGMQVYNSFSGCRNHSALHGEWDTHSSALCLQTQQLQFNILTPLILFKIR
jgi:hypothetical protein